METSKGSETDDDFSIPLAAIFLTALSLIFIFVVCRCGGTWSWMMSWIFSRKEEKASLTKTEGHYNANGYLVSDESAVDINLCHSGSFKRFEKVDHDFSFEMSDFTFKPTLQQPPEQIHDYRQDVCLPCGTIEMSNEQSDYAGASYCNDAYNNDFPESTSGFVSSSATQRQPSTASVIYPPQPLRLAPPLSYSMMIMHEKYASEKPEKVKFPPKRPASLPVVNQTLSRPVMKETAPPPVVNQTVCRLIMNKTGSPPVANQTVSRPFVSRTHSPPVANQTVSRPFVNRTHSPPVANQTVSRPFVNRTHSPPVANQTVSRPFVNRTHSPPVANQTVSPPFVNRTHSPPVANQTVSRLFVNRTHSSPVANQTVSPPFVNRTHSSSVANQTVSRPVVNRTHSSSVANQTVSPPFVNRTHSSSVANQTVSPPFVNRTHSPPVANQTVSPPFVNRTHSPPVANQTVSRPVVNRTHSSSVANQTVSRPVVNRTHSSSVANQTVSRPFINWTASPIIFNKTIYRLVMEETGFPPVVHRTVSRPFVNRTALPIIFNKTIYRLVMEETGFPPVVHQTVSRPFVSRTGSRSVVNKTVSRSSVSRTASPPVVNKAVDRPTDNQSFSLPLWSEAILSPLWNAAISTQAWNKVATTVVWSKIDPPPIPPRIQPPPLPPRKISFEESIEGEDSLTPLRELKRGVSFESISSDTSITLADLDGPYATGYLCVGLNYTHKNQILTVIILEAKDFDGHNLKDTLVEVSFLDKLPIPETKVRRNSNSQKYNETFKFNMNLDEFSTQTLFFNVYSNELNNKVPIGSGCIRMSGVSTTQSVTTWITLEHIGKLRSEWGEIMLSLNYQPATERLTIVVEKAKNLIFPDNREVGDSVVKVYLLKQGKKLYKKKTSIKYQERDPVYNEVMIFTISAYTLQCLQLRVTVADCSGGQKAVAIGHVIIGAQASGKTYSHWVQMMTSPRLPVSMWHSITK